MKTDLRLVKIVKATGDMDLADCVGVKGLVREFLMDGHVWVVLNLGHAEYVDMAGISILRQLRERLKQYGGDLVLADVKLYIRHVFELAGEDLNFKFYATEDQAVESFR